MSAGVEEDLLTRTSWVDAGVAYNKVKKVRVCPCKRTEYTVTASVML